MAVPKPVKSKIIRADIAKELNFIKNIFSVVSLPTKVENEDDQDYLIPSKNNNKPEENKQTQRAKSITELEERLQKLKSQGNFNLKKKLEKKSLSSKLNKKIKKRERLNKNKTIVKEPKQKVIKTEDVKTENVNIAKPVFNHDGKLVFSKFDFANMGKKEKPSKSAKDPKKILENLQQQEQKLHELEEKEEISKVKEIKEKVAWKNVLQKAEGQKVKDDPTLLKKSIKKMEQKKKHSQKQWESRIQGVQQKKDERQQKRKENISKKKKEKKGKIVKAAVKRGRVVI